MKIQTSCFCGILLFLGASFLTAQEISSVVFEQDGDYHFDEDVFRCNIQTRKGDHYSERVVNDDVKRLHGLGAFSDVVSVVRDTRDGKKEIVFKVVPKPVVAEIVYEGNKKYKTKKLMESVTLQSGVPLNDTNLSQSAEKLRAFYADEGLKNAEISARLETLSNRQLRVIFSITENLRQRVNKVIFEGNTVYDPSELKDAIATRYSFLSQSWLSWLPIQTGGLLDREELEKDRIRLREMFWRKGLLDFKIKEIKLEEVDGDPELVNVTFAVEEGEPYKIGKIMVSGGQRFPEEELLSGLTQKPGMVYNVQSEEQDLNELEHKYSPLGYADFERRAVRFPNYENHTVDLDYQIKEGPLYRIGAITITGNKFTKDHVIRRELPMLPDDPVDKNMIKVSKNRLMGMGYFQTVEAVAVNAVEDAKKDIAITVDEKRFIEGKIGAGWSDTDGLAGMIELSHSNMDILDPKNYFTGGGQRMRIRALAGIEHFDVETNFTEPWLFGYQLRFDISGYWREVLYDDWSEQRLGLTTSLTKRIFDDFTTITGGYTFEYVRVIDMDRKLSEVFQSERGGSYVGRIHLGLERDTRDSATDPHSGYQISAYTAVTSRAFGGSNDYYKVELKGINYLPFIDDLFILETGAKIGMIQSIGTNDMVPIYDRYFLGGGDSIRGFPYRSIGPVDNNDDNYGGQFMYLFKAELSHPIYSIFRGAFFVDVGDVTRGIGPMNAPNVGLGYGLRIKIPNIDVPIRLDLAYPVLSNQEGVARRLRFHFNMGFSL